MLAALLSTGGLLNLFQFDAFCSFDWSRISRTMRPSEVGLYGFGGSVPRQ